MNGDPAAGQGRSAGILVGFDHSPAGAAALRWAVRQGCMQGRHLHVIHAWEPEPGEVASLTPEQHVRTREAVVAACTKRIKEVLAELSAPVDAEIEILEGPAGPILIEHAVPLASSPAQAHTGPPEINLAEHRIRRKQVLGGLTHEYQVAA